MKRILSLGLVLTMICTLLTFMPATAASIIDSGTCGAQGDNLKWTLDSEGILTISGTGEMKDYGATGLTASPWGSYNSKIKKIIIGNRITNIGTMAFWFCNNLTDITIPQGVTSIGMGAFAYCTALKEISLPDSITFMGSGAFIHCDNIKNMYIPSIESWLKIDLEDIETSPVSFKDNACVYINGKLAKNISIPDNITEIGKYAFSFWSCLETVKLPDGITKIGNASFRGCKNLRTINLPNTVTSIVGGPFEDCEKLEYIKIPYGVTDISGNCFANCKSLKRVYLPKSITSIGSFVGCSSLTEIIIPNNVKNIDSFSFSGCNSLKKVYIPNNITSIDYGAFFGSDKITDVYYGGNKAQWDKIDINNENGENNSLLNAAIHYNSAIPVEPMLFITNYTDTSVTVETVNISNLRTTVVLAVYEKNGALRFMTTKSAADAVRFNDIDLRNSNIKVMLWSDMDSAKPLAETAEMSL